MKAEEMSDQTINREVSLDAVAADFRKRLSVIERDLQGIPADLADPWREAALRMELQELTDEVRHRISPKTRATYKALLSKLSNRLREIRPEDLEALRHTAKFLHQVVENAVFPPAQNRRPMGRLWLLSLRVIRRVERNRLRATLR